MTGRRGTLAVYRRALKEVRPHWGRLTVIFVLGLSATPLALLTPLPLKIAVDSVVGSHPLPALLESSFPVSATSKETLLWVVLALLGVITALGLAQRYGQWMLTEYTGNRMVLDFRKTLFQHVQRLSLSHHDSSATSEATYAVQYDAPSIQQLTIWGIIPLIGALFTLAGVVFVTARISVSLALVALAMSPVLVFLTAAHSPVLRSRWERIKSSESTSLSIVQEVFSAIRLVKAFGQEDRETKRFTQHSSTTLRERMRVIMTEVSLGVSTGITVGVGTALVLWIGVRQVLAGQLTVGEMLLVMSYVAQLFTPLQTLGRQVAEQQSAIVSARRSFELLDVEPPTVRSGGGKALRRASGHVEFQDVDFAYKPDHPVLRRVNLSVSPGTVVGIAGPTGSGKSTLLNLLVRFYDPTAGRILLDGIDLRDYRLDDLRDQFSIVLQEPILFSTSIAENIAYGRPDATEEEVVAAARAAEAHDFIVKLGAGYETKVGPRGGLLSGGERQRITLARAFLRDSPILVLDEPTSSIDVHTEESVMRAMRRLMQGRTTFMIAHRLRTLDDCDVLLWMRDGALQDASDQSARPEGRLRAEAQLATERL
jgi:ATP-binding cassette subfamily B protein